MRTRFYLATGCLALAGACSSIHSTITPDTGVPGDGLAYYMPKKDFVVVVTVENHKPSKVALSTSAAYPDLSKQYILGYGYNAFGKNTLDIGISQAGLLTSAKSTTTSSVTEALKNLAQSAGLLRGLVQPETPKTRQADCHANGDYTFVYPTPATYTPCGVTVEIKALGSLEAHGVRKQVAEAHSGVFYRQNLPYVMTAKGDSIANAAIVQSPSESPVYFLPVARTFFSNNSAELTFTDGMPTQYKQEADGDAIALFKLPAEVIAAYFAAVGSAFDNFKTRDSKEAEAMATSIKLELARQKYEACLAAIKAKDETRAKELKCGE